MKIEIGENNSLLVFLTKQEVHTLHLDGPFTLEEEASRKILQAVYRDAALSAGFVPEAYEKRITELLPFSDGSMLLCFSFPGKRCRLKVSARMKKSYKIYELFSAADLAAFLNSAASLHCVPEAVYESEGSYRFIIDSRAHTLERLLKEYAEPVSAPLALQSTKEYWRAVYTNSDETAR